MATDPPKIPLPEWKKALLAIPEAYQCPTQRDLIRALELVDRLIELYATGKPQFNSDAHLIRGFMTALETSFYSFKGNYVYSLFPEDLSNEILKEGATKAAFEYGFSHPFAAPDKPEDALHFAAQRLWTSVYILKPKGMMNADSSKVMGSGLQMLDQVLGETSQNGGDDVLLRENSRLTMANLLNISAYTQVVFMLDSHLGKKVEAAAKGAVQRYLEILEKGKICWYSFSNYNMVFSRLQDVAGLNVAEDLLVRVLRRYLEDAEKESDPFRTAWVSYELASHWSLQGGTYTEIEALLEKGDSAAELCKSWMPKFFRNSAFVAQGRLETMLAAAREESPDNYQDMPLNTLSMNRNTKIVSEPLKNALRTCAACSIESRGMSNCKAVSDFCFYLFIYLVDCMSGF